VSRKSRIKSNRVSRKSSRYRKYYTFGDLKRRFLSFKNDKLYIVNNMSEYEVDFKKLYETTLSEKNYLQKEVEILTEHLKKYTAPSRNKKYYENHKEERLDYSKEYMKNLDPEKIKEYNKRAYQKRKQKNQKDENEIS
jgi:ribosomal protein L11 methylase PrmA